MSLIDWQRLRTAFAFFTRLPVGSRSLATDFRGAAAWLPLVGLVVGGLAGLCLGLAALFFPPLVCGVLGCLAWLFVSGGLHLDGVADCGDGLWLEASPVRRLEVMRDSCLGTFGGAALFLLLVLKIACLTALAATVGQSPTAFCLVILACSCAGLLARSAVFILMRQPSARPGGLGEALHQGVGLAEEGFAAGAALLAALFASAFGLHGLPALFAVLCLALGLAAVARRRLGGVTGDVFGCLVETGEAVALLAFSATV